MEGARELGNAAIPYHSRSFEGAEKPRKQGRKLKKEKSSEK